MEAMKNFSSALTNVGFWSPSCVQHGFTVNSWNNDHYRIPSKTGITISDAVWNFINNVSNKTGNSHIDPQSWPHNQGCSANDQSNLRKRLTQLLLTE